MDKVGGLGTAAGYGRDQLKDYGGAACEVERQPHVAEDVIGHRSVSERLSEITVTLEKRLGSVIRSEPQASDGLRKEGPRPTKVDLAEAIESNNTLLEQSYYRLRGILDRLEL